jgi:hypothetical protein
MGLQASGLKPETDGARDGSPKAKTPTERRKLPNDRPPPLGRRRSHGAVAVRVGLAPLPDRQRNGDSGVNTAQERLRKGLCPRCGKEAAPYRLCRDHRLMDMLARCMRAGAQAGHVTAVRSTGRGRSILWGLSDKGKAAAAAPNRDNSSWNFRAAFEGRAGWEDKRYRPRLGGVPADIEREISNILIAFGRPATIDEIVAAWGKLRETRMHKSVAGDLVALIAAERKRNARNAKRLFNSMGIAGG